MKRKSRPGYINLGGKNAGNFICMAIEQYIFHGDREGIRLIGFLTDRKGNHPPVQEMIRWTLMETGRLLNAARPRPNPPLPSICPFEIRSDGRRYAL